MFTAGQNEGGVLVTYGICQPLRVQLSKLRDGFFIEHEIDVETSISINIYMLELNGCGSLVVDLHDAVSRGSRIIFIIRFARLLSIANNLLLRHVKSVLDNRNEF
ncbi:hypothetical protein DBR23_13070 [Acidovorax sp. HMWF018]|nr:hypothetical protein DBR23_13070 [Acidovorax sp. HMWF018]